MVSTKKRLYIILVSICLSKFIYSQDLELNEIQENKNDFDTLVDNLPTTNSPQILNEDSDLKSGQFSVPKKTENVKTSSKIATTKSSIKKTN